MQCNANNSDLGGWERVGGDKALFTTGWRITKFPPGSIAPRWTAGAVGGMSLLICRARPSAGGDDGMSVPLIAVSRCSMRVGRVRA